MKKTFKKALAAMSAAAMLMSVGAAGVLADASDAAARITATETVTRIDCGYLAGQMRLGASDEENAFASDDGELYLYKNENTLVLNASGEKITLDDISEGALIEFYVDGNSPATLQLPVHYTADVIVLADEENVNFRKIGIFNENMVNEENTLELVSLEGAKIYNADEFKGGKALVLYSSSTKSIPAQTVPMAIVKLNDDVSEEEPDLSKVKEIKIGGETLRHIPVTVNGVQMLPVRAVAEGLGFEVEWLGETKTVIVGDAAFDIDNESCRIGDAELVLTQAPTLIALPDEPFALTYVPLDFFTEVLGCEIYVDGNAATMELK